MSVLGILASETGFMASQLNSPFVSTFSHPEQKWVFPGFLAVCFGGSAMSYHRTKHKPLFLGSWVKERVASKGPDWHLSSFHAADWPMLQK